MITAVLQCLIAALKLGFGVAALRAARLTREEGVRSTAWLLTGTAFALAGLNSVPHSLWALSAVLAGPDAAVYGEYLRWAPAVNYSRHAVMLVTPLLLLGLPLLCRLDRGILVRCTVGLLAGSGVLGGWMGTMDGDGGWARHFTVISALDSAEMILFGAALLASLVLGTMDRILWIALVVYATRQAINVVSFSALAWFQVPGAWSPSPQHIAWIGALHWALLLGLARHRLRLAARGERTPPLLEPLAGRTHSTLP